MLTIRLTDACPVPDTCGVVKIAEIVKDRKTKPLHFDWRVMNVAINPVVSMY